MKDETFLEIKTALARTGCTYLDDKDYWYLVGKIEELEAQVDRVRGLVGQGVSDTDAVVVKWIRAAINGEGDE